jgi:bacillithiol biosynthesis cysteine-adding enzyme BshC
MLHKSIPFENTGLYSKIILDYIRQADTIKPFFEYAPSMDSFREVMGNRKFTQQKRDVLVEALLKQYAEIGVTAKQAKTLFANIEALKDSNTFTVTTGHQLALFTGPLFFIYKILSTIRLSQELKALHPEKHFVPVFWLASEDHDFAEINHIYLDGKKISWDLDPKNQPVGTLPLDGLETMIAEVKKVLADSPDKAKLIALFEEAYTTSKTLSEATRKIVHALFTDYGLIMIEPNDVVLKKQFIEVMHSDIENNNSFAALSSTNSKLERSHYKLQIHGREINFFYLSAEGRNLIKKTATGYEISQTELTFTDDEMKREIDEHPERFSPNVVLRPVYQEAILPNLAYIGGPGEAAYWLQLKFVFQAHAVDFPMIVLRNSVMLMKTATLHKLTKKGISIEQLFLKEEELIKAFISEEYPLNLEEQVAHLDAIAQQSIEMVMPFDNKIAADLIKWKVGMNEYMERARKEIFRKKKEKSDEGIQQLLEMRNGLFPAGAPQERQHTLLQHTGDYYAYFIEGVAKSIQPLSHSMDILLND